MWTGRNAVPRLQAARWSKPPGAKIVPMPVRISCVCIDAVEPRLVADFWAAGAER